MVKNRKVDWLSCFFILHRHPRSMRIKSEIKLKRHKRLMIVLTEGVGNNHSNPQTFEIKNRIIY